MSRAAAPRLPCDAPRPHGPNSEAVPLPTLIGRLSEEIRELAGLSDGLQSALDLAAGATGRDAGFLASAQSLDLLSQRLDGLSAFLADLSETAPTSCSLDLARAASGIVLEGLKARLCRTDAAVAPASGELDLF